MSAPKRLRLYADGLVVSAFVLLQVDAPSGDKPVCKECAPRRTKMQHLAEVRIRLRDGFEVYNAFECLFCHRQWAVAYLDARSEVQ